MVVSERWTPNHVDVTHLPMTYARPKAAWIDRYSELRPTLRSDVIDRMERRRDQDRSVVDPNEIPVLPPLATAPVPMREAAEPERDWRHFGVRFVRRPAH
jgi:hypothetical protein